MATLSHRLRRDLLQARWSDQVDQALSLVEHYERLHRQPGLNPGYFYICYARHVNLTEGMGKHRNLTRVATARDLATCTPMDVRLHVNTGYPDGYRQQSGRRNDSRYSV